MTPQEAAELIEGDVVTNPAWEDGQCCIVESVNPDLFPDDPIVFFLGGGFWRSSRLRLVTNEVSE